MTVVELSKGFDEETGVVKHHCCGHVAPASAVDGVCFVEDVK